MVVAAGGDAFLVRPDGVTLDGLEHYLAMTPDARAGAPGAERLAELVGGGHPAVAREALDLLEAEPADADRLDADGAASLLAAARSSERDPALRSSALRLAARDRLPGTRETALVLTEPASPIRADAYRALAVLPGGLSAERVDGLLGNADPDLRAVGIEVAPASTDRARFVTFVRDDPSPAVRLAAGRALVVRFGAGAIADVTALLDDPDTAVRSGIAESIGSLGAAAVAPLRAVVDGPSERAALAAVLGLTRAGRQGAVAIASIAETHQNKAVRTFAQLALGKAPGHTH
jgi:HEAT repeat protein